MKSTLLLLLTLLLSGVGLTLYLPEYTPDGISAPAFQLLQETLTQPVDGAAYLASNALLDAPADAPLPQGLQLSIHGSIAAAQSAALQLARRELDLPMLPTIFKSVQDTRDWYVLALGPFITADEAAYRASVLQEKDVWVQTILWPTSPPARQDAPQ